MEEYVICVGAQKAGTTLFYNQLSKHQRIKKPYKKELYYFDRVDRPSKEEYDKLFMDTGKAEDIKLDVTPNYMYYPEAVDKIASTLGIENVKIVVILRDPIKRAESHYYMSVRKRHENLTFEESYDKEAERIKENVEQFRLFSYFSRGKYYEQLKRIYNVFPEERVKIMIFEKFTRNQQEYLDEIADFLLIDRIMVSDIRTNEGFIIKNKLLHKLYADYGKRMPLPIKRVVRRLSPINLDSYKKKFKEEKKEISREFYNILIDYYKEDVELLEKEFEIDTSLWSVKAGKR